MKKYIMFILFVSCSTIPMQREAMQGVYFEDREIHAPDEDVKNSVSFFQSDTFKNREQLVKNKQEYPCFVFIEWTNASQKKAFFCDKWNPGPILLLKHNFVEHSYIWNLNTSFFRDEEKGDYVNVELGKCERSKYIDGKQTNIQLLDMSDPKCKPSVELVEWRDRLLRMLDHYGIKYDSDEGDPRVYPHEIFKQIMKDFEDGKW